MTDNLIPGNPEKSGANEKQEDIAQSSTATDAYEEKKGRHFQYKAWDKLKVAYQWLTNRKPDFYIAWATIIMVMTTVIYTYYARKQWKEMQSEQRAWIEIHSLEAWPNDKEPDDFKNIRIVWTNVGKSVARGVSLVVFVDYCKEDDLPASIYDYSKDTKREYGDVSPVSGFWDFIQKHHDCKTWASQPLPSDFDYATWLTNGKKFIIHGRFDYFDAFGHPHWIQFCNVSQPQRNEFIACSDAPGQGGNGHNKTDEDK